MLRFVTRSPCGSTRRSASTSPSSRSATSPGRSATTATRRCTTSCCTAGCRSSASGDWPSGPCRASSVSLLPLVWIAGRRAAGRIRRLDSRWPSSPCRPTPCATAPRPACTRWSCSCSSSAGCCRRVALERPRPLLLAAWRRAPWRCSWSHYWAMWLGSAHRAAPGGPLVHRSPRRRRPTRPGHAPRRSVRSPRGAVLFLPWVPRCSTRRSTPAPRGATGPCPPRWLAISCRTWRRRQGDQILFGWLLVIVALIGIFGARPRRGRTSTSTSAAAEGRPSPDHRHHAGHRLGDRLAATAPPSSPATTAVLVPVRRDPRRHRHQPPVGPRRAAWRAGRPGRCSRARAWCRNVTTAAHPGAATPRTSNRRGRADPATSWRCAPTSSAPA